jgi:hypothetical protein
MMRERERENTEGKHREKIHMMRERERENTEGKHREKTQRENTERKHREKTQRLKINASKYFTFMYLPM